MTSIGTAGRGDSTVRLTWRSTHAQLRAAVLGGLGTLVALAAHRPDVLVIATPFLVVATWGWLRRPRGEASASMSLGHTSIRESEGTRVLAVLDVPEGTDEVAVGLTPNLFLDVDPPTGVVGVAPPPDWRDESGAAVRPASGHAGRQQVAVPLRIRPTRWGVQQVGPMVVIASGPWWAHRCGPSDVPGLTLTALPQPAAYDSSAPMPHPEGLVGANRSVRSGSGSEFAGLRGFQPGDRLRRIHWPVSLRTGSLHVAATYADEDSTVVLVLDAFSDLGPREGIDGRPTSLDVTVRAASAIAEHYLAVGDRVGMRVVGASQVPRVPVGSGRAHLRRVLGTLALIHPATERHDDRRQGVAGIGAGSVVFVLSPLVDRAIVETVGMLGSRGLTTVVVDTMPEHLWTDDTDVYASLAWRLRRLTRQVDVENLAAAGIAVVPWRGAASLDQVLRDVSRRARAPRLVRR